MNCYQEVTWTCTAVNHDSSRLKEMKPVIQLNQFVGATAKIVVLKCLLHKQVLIPCIKFNKMSNDIKLSSNFSPSISIAAWYSNSTLTRHTSIVTVSYYQWLLLFAASSAILKSCFLYWQFLSQP